MDCLTANSSNFILPTGSESYLPVDKRQYKEMCARIDNSSKAFLIGEDEINNLSSKTELLKGRLTFENPPRNADSAESTESIENSDGDDAGSVSDSNIDETNSVIEENCDKINFEELEFETVPYIAHTDVRTALDWVKNKPFMATITGVELMVIGAGVFFSAGRPVFIDLGAQLALAGAAFIIGGSMFLKNEIELEEENREIGFNEID